ncbi:hypothetical protein VC83_03291 [Pseudogymnoascus destructans]|uniref:Uncharacterized protein n=2 Tax=Pseudogymnoascus destructans TaxID=655981 RepID=A0A177AEN4_9PEZI|nr:uncharacterized protein VC83_03291 [Pseudogymnoascus destructans]OAF60568.1 hypothetical protein VC83_03291 [Pseudogymnoascus destructans]
MPLPLLRHDLHYKDLESTLGLAEGASISSSANQTDELYDPNFKSETFFYTLGKTAQERRESILANRHEKAEWNVETFDEFQKLSVTNQKMAWTLHKNILQDYLALAEDSNSILAEKDDAILQLQELIQSNEQQITEQQTIQKYLEKQTQQALKNEPGHHSHSRLSARIPNPPILTDGIEPAFEDWVMKIRLKLEANIDHFPTQTLQMSYIQSRLGGLAVRYVNPRLRPNSIKNDFGFLLSSCSLIR